MPKIHWESTPNVSEDARAANSLVIEKLSLPKHRGAGRLAVVGSGPSINNHIEELRNWDGAIWAVNGTINWCNKHGIDAWFYTADAMPPSLWPHQLSGISKAVLTPDISPEMVAQLQGMGAEVTLTGPPKSGPTSANASDYLSIECGYTNVTFFGCEGSFDAPAFGAASHAFLAYDIPDWMIIENGGEYFKSKSEFVSQAIMLANTIRAFPAIYSEKSGGLLRSMIKNGPEYDVYMVANTLLAKLKDKPDQRQHDETMLALIEYDMMVEAAA